MSELSDKAAEIRQRWEDNQENPSSLLDEEDAINMGIIHPEDDENFNKNPQQTEQTYEYMDGEPEERQYEKLSKWETTKDIAKSVGVEALHFFQPKDRETQYESRTHFGENMKYTYRYGVGTLAFLSSFLWGGGEVATAGALIKGATMLPKAVTIGGSLIKLGQGIQKLNQVGRVVKPLKAGLKAARAGKDVKSAMTKAEMLNGMFQGIPASALADFTLYRPEENEGHFMDMLGETDNSIISFLQTHEDDTAFEARMKNVADGFLIGIPFGGLVGGATAKAAMKPAIRKWLKGMHKAVNAQTAEEAAQGIGETIGARIPIDNIAKTMDMVTEVDKVIAEANETGQEVSQLIIDRFPTTEIEEARAMAKLREAGEEIFPYEDGTWSAAVRSYEDAYKVTPEQYKYQLDYQDQTGNLAIQHMDNAVEDTWHQRGLIDGDGLHSKKASERNSTTKQIVDYYTDKWDLNNKPIVKNQSAIDKKKLQIKKLEDKITMAEGGNKEISDPLDNLKEQLRIAQEDLEKLENPQPKAKNSKITVKYGDWSNIPDGKTTQYKNGNVLIQINTNSPDIYATLRSELEHARDFIKGEKPIKADVEGSGEHFARYIGDNEAEVAPQYTYKKSQGKARATSQNVMNDGQTINNELKYNQEVNNGQRTNTTETSVKREVSSEDFMNLIEQLKKSEGLDDAEAVERLNNNGIKLKDEPTDNQKYEFIKDEETTTNNISLTGHVENNGTIFYDENNPEVLSGHVNRPLDSSQFTPENIGASIVKGDIDFSNPETVDKVITNLVNNDPEISGTTFEDVLADSDSYFYQMVKDDPMSVAAYLTDQTPDARATRARKQLMTIRLMSVLRDIQANATPKENLEILTTIKQLGKYVKTVGSNVARDLRYQTVVNKALDVFGAEKYSDLALQGLKDLADILDIQSSNFTRNQSLKDFKAEIFRKLKENDKYNEIMGDRNLYSKMNEVIETQYDALKKGQKIDSTKTIMKILNRDEAEVCGWYAKLADTTKGFVDTIVHWGNEAPKYVINNVLGVASAFKNLSSGIVQSNLYPTYRILGGFLTGNGEITKEGVDQWLGTFVNFGEAMRLAKQAFIKGEGLLTNTKEMFEGNLQDSFHKWATNLEDLSNEGFLVTLQNIHSFIPRCMMASDEFMKQLNYRNLVRAKALSQARREASTVGVDFAQTADEIFRKTAFNEDGKPLDFQAYTEAADALFQIPLNRKMFNPATGEVENTGIDKSMISEFGSWIQEGTQKFVPLRIFNPFVKTPSNIADQALKANPLYMAFNSNTRKQFFSTDPEIRAKAIGKFTTMLALGAGFCFAAAQGIITGSEPFDKKEKTALFKTGWRPYSIKIGDKWIPYMNMVTPLDSYMAFCADNVALVGKNLSKEQEMGMDAMAGQILGNIMNEYIDQAGFRTNTEKMMDIFNPSTDVRVREKLAANLFSGFLPMSGNVNAVRSVVKTIKGDTQQKKPEGFYDNLVKNYTDVFTSTQDYKRDVFGNRIDQYGLLIAKATDDKFMQPEYEEMRRMAEKGYTPAVIGHMLKKTGVPLEEFKSTVNGRSAYDAMYDELTELKIGGKTLQQAVAELITSPRYKTLNDGINSGRGEDWSSVPYKTKKKLLDDTFQRYYTQAKNKVIIKRGKEFVDKNGMTMQQRQKEIKMQMLSERNADNLKQSLDNLINRF